MTIAPAAQPQLDFFLARSREQREFRQVLRQFAPETWREALPTLARSLAWLLPDRREPDPDPTLPWIFLFHGEGGMGKSTLLRRLQAIATGQLAAVDRQFEADRAWVDRLAILTIDWESERVQRPSLQGPRESIELRPILDVLRDTVVAAHGEKWFSEYETRLKDLAAIGEKVQRKIDEERQQGDKAGWAKTLGPLTKFALRMAGRGDVAETYEPQIDAIAEALPTALPQAAQWLKATLKREDLDLFERPQEVLAAALGKGLAKLAQIKPLLIFMDTYEVVDRVECDAVVRQVMKSAGGRVIWVVAGRSNLYNSGKRGEVYFKGYRNDFPEAKLSGKALDEFGETEIREYFDRKVADRPLSDADVLAIREFSLGIPFVVATVAAIWQECPALSLAAILAPAPTLDNQTPRDRVIAAMTERFLVHCLQGGSPDLTQALSADLQAIYALAIVRQPDQDLLKAMLATADLGRTLANLEARYSFIWASDRRLHDNVLAFLRPYLLAPAQRSSPAVQDLNDRALAHLDDRLAYWCDELPDLADRLASANAKAVWLDAAHHRFWRARDRDRDENEAWKAWVGPFVDGWLVDREFARDLVQVAGFFSRTFSPDGRRRYGCFESDWDQQHKFDCEARKKLLEELTALSRRGWLAEETHPERGATLDLERARLLYGEKQYKLALTALQDLDHRQAHPSPALRTEIAALYSALAKSFLWQPIGNGKYSVLVPSPEGLQAAQRATELNQGNAGYFGLLGDCFKEQKRYDEAIASYQRAIDLEPNNATHHNILGNVYRHLEQYDEAIASYQRVINLEPNNATHHNILGDVYQDLEQYENAINSYQRAIDLDSKIAYYYTLANLYRKLKRHDEAIASYQRVINLDPNNADLHTLLGNVYRDLKRYDEAIAAYQRSINLDQNDIYAHNMLGNVYSELKRYDEAITAFQRAINLDPNHAYSHNQIGDVYQDLEQYENAVDSYQRAIDLDSTIAYYHTDLGNVYRNLKRYNEAITSYQQAINLDPNFAGFHNNLGNVYCNLKRYDEAIAAFQRAINLDPNFADFHNKLGAIYNDLKRYDEAIASYRRAIDLDPQNTSPYYDLGLLQFQQGDLSGTIATFQKAAELDPTDGNLQNNLGFLCLTSDRLTEAESHLLKARELDPQAFISAFNLAAVRALQNNLDSARSLLTESLQLCPEIGDQAKLYRAIGLIILGDSIAGFSQLETTIASLTDPITFWPIRGGVLEAAQEIGRSSLASPDLQRAIDLLQAKLTRP